jgi:D-alanine-D-alanine ligase
MLKIGLTYDLKDDYKTSGLSAEDIAEFDTQETIDGLEAAVAALGFRTDRIGNIKALAGRLVGGDRWDLVFNIAEGVRGPGRESEVPCLLEAYEIPYVFSDPLVLALCLHKGMTKRVVRDSGLLTPDFLVLEEPEDARNVDLPFPLFAKPVAEGTGKGISPISKITSQDELVRIAAALIEKYRQPVLVETYLPGREFTVGITGTGKKAEVVGSMEIIYEESAEGSVYSYTNKAEYEKRISYLPGGDENALAACGLALSAYRALGCRDGGRIDVREDAEGRPSFIEVNPLAGLNPLHSDFPILSRLFDVSYEELIKRILDSALERYRLL